VGGAVEGGADEHVSLQRRERGHAGKRSADLQSLLDQLVDLLSTSCLRYIRGYGRGGAKLVEGDVVGDAI
jgi:hypothetical protein